MGLYTSFRCKLKLKDEFLPVIRELMEEGLDWSELETNSEEINEFSTYDRADSIPFGGLSYAPDEWEQEDNTIWSRSTENGIWTFQCSVKNSETILEFMRRVVPAISVESLHLEMFFEEDVYSTMYKLIDGKVEEIDEKNKYGFEDNDDYEGFGYR
ncbi:hypothetical protein LOZ80_39020 [Paenibacillus sp. HWE-109]|uniref:hypothetical protein n=1 Tax=Paenibacillus sp. HWE-109 TaxID=1306526 RepID=UPI001EDD34BA|nr:hypothetical protein [Paenibacillus sp. HWE-109]UKS27359.1 hypothetical protein LOZ80_39020 [Paenibacillus sp. HWE-109]